MCPAVKNLHTLLCAQLPPVLVGSLEHVYSVVAGDMGTSYSRVHHWQDASWLAVIQQLVFRSSHSLYIWGGHVVIST